MLAPRQVANMFGQGSPTTAGPEHTPQHADVHVDRPVRDAGVVAGALKIFGRRRCDLPERKGSPKPLFAGQELPLPLPCPRRGAPPLRLAVGFYSLSWP